MEKHEGVGGRVRKRAAQCGALTCDSHAPAVFPVVYGFQDLVGTAHKALGTALRETRRVTRKHKGLAAARRQVGYTEGRLFQRGGHDKL